MMRADRRRTTTIVLGVAFSYFLMVFQGGLFIGFLTAAGKVISASGASIWVMPGDVPCFEFGAPMRDAVSLELLGVPGVIQTARVVVGSARWLGPKGEQRTVMVVGSERLAGSTLPTPADPWGSAGRLPHGAVLDVSALRNLGITRMPTEVEINGGRGTVVAATTGFGSFLGTPYVFVGYDDARKILGIVTQKTMMVGASLAPGADLRKATADARARYPDLQVLSTAEFAHRSGIYWMTQTGAGGAITLAGLLGVLVGALIISQTLYAATVERLEEFATLLAVGASESLPRRIVALQAVGCAAGGAALGAMIAWPLVAGAKRYVVAWIAIPWWLPAGCLVLALAVAISSSRTSLRLIRGVDPVRVFRS